MAMLVGEVTYNQNPIICINIINCITHVTSMLPYNIQTLRIHNTSYQSSPQRIFSIILKVTTCHFKIYHHLLLSSRYFITNIMKLFTVLLIVLIVQLQTAEVPYKKLINSLDPQAKCLDGSPPALYLHEGGDKNNILIFLFGGGLCGSETLAESIESCYQRSKTELGSSKYWPDNLIGPGYLSTDPSVSRFANWTKIIFTYCDGSLHQGSAKNPLKYKDADLYFRGAQITRSHFKWINNTYNLYNAQRVVLTGGSAGGIGAYLWTNYLRSIVKEPSVVYSIPDSGIFMNHPSAKSNRLLTQTVMENTFKLANIDEKSPIPICNKAHSGAQWKCLFLQYSFGSIEGKILLINSGYDAYEIPNLLQVQCLKPSPNGFTLLNCTQKQINQIEAYRKDYQTFLGNFLQIGKNSAWSISCSTHVYACVPTFWDSEHQKVPEGTGLTVRNAVQRFVFNNQRITAVDLVAWPLNKACSI